MNHASYYLLDVFTEEKFGGNQLAIFPDARFIQPELFQKIARELNLSETVFLFPPEKEPYYRMRIFTPGQELPTAGHPTVGTGYYLTRELHPGPTSTTQIKLQQEIGLITVDVKFKNNQPDMITMYQPLPKFGPIHSISPELASLLSIEEEDLDQHPIQEVSCGNNVLLIPVKDTEVLSKISFRMDVWQQIKSQIHDAFIYVFTLKGVTGGDVQGRMFAPDAGILEDPATGSANGPLICYLHLYELVKNPIKSLQGYEMGRPSQLFLDVSKNAAGEIREVKVGGKCVYIGKGTLYLDIA